MNIDYNKVIQNRIIRISKYLTGPSIQGVKFVKDDMTCGEKHGISAAALKIIAVITMAIDHTAAGVIYRMVQYRMLPNGEDSLFVYWTMRIIGRMAFPIYIFLLVESFFYTHSRKKYALRLFIFALISELPFDMALFHSYCDWKHNNVFFELLLGLLMLCCLDFLWNRWKQIESIRSVQVQSILRGILSLAVVAVFACLAEYVVCCDYGDFGIVAIAILYFFRKHRALAFTMAVLALFLSGSQMEIAALLMVIPLYFYNGNRGHQMKYFFYAFYPVHLLLIAGVCMIMGMGI